MPIFLLALVWPQPREGLRRAALAVVAVAVVLGGYLQVQKHQVGATGFSRASGWSSYSRVGQFADCSKFTPPAGTEKLCEKRPPSERPSTDFYFWSGGSPARLAFGPPNTNDEQVGAFAHAALRAQPGDYLKAVGQDFARYVWPEHYRRRRSGETQAHYFAQATTRARRGVRPLRDVRLLPGHPGDPPRRHGVTSAYMSVTWIRGPLMALLLGLALAAPLLARGRRPPRRARLLRDRVRAADRAGRHAGLRRALRAQRARAAERRRRARARRDRPEARATAARHGIDEGAEQILAAA